MVEIADGIVLVAVSATVKESKMKEKEEKRGRE